MADGLSAAAFAKALAAADRPAVVNPKGLRRWRAALDDALYGVASIVVMGDSISVGVGADGNAANGGSGSDSTYRDRGYVGQLRSLFALTYGDPGEGFVGGPYVDGGQRWAFAGGAASNQGVGPYSSGARAASNTQTITVTLPACTDIEFSTWDGGGGTCSYAVDGGSATTFSGGNGTSSGTTWTKRTITGLASATHTVVFTGPATGAGLYLAGVSALKQTKGVQVHRLAKAGNTTANLVGATSDVSGAAAQARIAAAAGLVPATNLLIIPLGVNDFTNQNSLSAAQTQPGTIPSTYKTNLQTIVDSAITNGACVLLVGEPRQNSGNYPSPMTYTEQDYYDKAREIAAATDHCAFVDINEVWASNVAGHALSYFTTGSVHPTRKGHGSMARILHRILTRQVPTA